ncbi:MAG: hypothetical protein V1738_02505 [Patescibacteria group bacterium]
MPKWRIIIPVAIVAIIGVIAYLQVAPHSEPAPPPSQPVVPAVEAPAEESLDVTGDEDVEVQVDALVQDLLNEAAEEDTEAGDGSAEIESITAGESELDILDVEYYAE